MLKCNKLLRLVVNQMQTQRLAMEMADVVAVAAGHVDWMTMADVVVVVAAAAKSAAAIAVVVHLVVAAFC